MAERVVDRQNQYLRIESVTKRFGDFVAVDNVSLSIFKGEIFCLLGGSGCGKTTLLRMLAGFESPTSGRILIDGQDMSGIPPYERPVNMMFQSYALFPHLSVWENIAFGLKREGMPRNEINTRVEEMLRLTRLEKFARRKPHQISGGQRQRIAIARAILADPRILILDEATSNLDTESESLIQASLKELMHGRTTFVIAHRLSTIRQADQILVIEQGQVVEQGKHEELLAKKGRYFDLYTYQARI